jgi:L-lactate dehydrogenase complex protein LldG
MVGHPQMKTARDEIFERIRSAVSSPAIARAPDYAAIERPYHQQGRLDPEARLKLFTERLIDYDAVVYRCAAPELPGAIAEAMIARGKRSLVIPRNFHTEWLPAGFEFPRDEELPHEDLDRREGSLTGCTAAIAATGSILLGHSAAEGRRALTLIPDYHLCVVFAEQVVETVPEAIRQLAGCSTVTTISGPSATADIEMTRIKGVHGPRSFDVILVVIHEAIHEANP